MRYLPRSIIITSYFFPLKAAVHIMKGTTAQKCARTGSVEESHELVTKASSRGRESRRGLFFRSEVVALLFSVIWLS